MAQFDVHKVRRQAGALFDGFTTGQKAMLAIAGLAVTVGLWTVTRSGGADMAPLYSNLSAEDASSQARATSIVSAGGLPAMGTPSCAD